MQNFQKNLKILRIDSGLTQTQFAEKIEVKRTAYCQWEYGNSEPSLDNLVKIATYYNVSIDNLLNFQINPIKIQSNEKSTIASGSNSNQGNKQNKTSSQNGNDYSCFQKKNHRITRTREISITRCEVYNQCRRNYSPDLA